ncbi:MAG: flagellar export chaperone FliS [Bacillota bacterium]|nr:flagellar export chaperone FliS [Candidatus Fermentithermobacillaceae bacterium]
MAIVTGAYGTTSGRDRALSTYRQMSIETAAPAELVLMLYNRALRTMEEAADCLGRKDMERSNQRLQKAQDIVDELRFSLNIEAGGKLASDLAAVYEYVNSRLLMANIKKDASFVGEAARVLTEIRDGWAEVVEKHGYR